MISIAVGTSTLYAITQGGNSYLIALSLEKGAQLWDKVLGPDAPTAPVVDANDVAFIASTSIVSAYRSVDGFQLWYFALKGIVQEGEAVLSLALGAQGNLVLALDSARVVALGVVAAPAQAAAGLPLAAVIAIAVTALCVVAAAVAAYRAHCRSGDDGDVGYYGGGGGGGEGSRNNPFAGLGARGGGWGDSEDEPYNTLTDAAQPSYMASGSYGWGPGVK